MVSVSRSEECFGKWNGDGRCRGSHVTTILSSLNSDRKEELFCDVTLEVDGKKFPAHRCVLANVSLFFRKMFNTNMKEKYDQSVLIHEIDSDVMKIILDFIYGDEVDVNEDDVMNLLKGSNFLQIDELKYFCGMSYGQQMNVHNCLEFYNLGQTFACNSLCDNAVETAANNMEDLSNSDEFKELDKDTIFAIIRSVENEKSHDACKAVLVWVKHDVDKRKEYLSDLFKLIDFTQLSNEYMNETLDHDDLVNASHECKNLFMSELLRRLKVEQSSSKGAYKRHEDSALARDQHFGYYPPAQYYDYDARSSFGGVYGGYYDMKYDELHVSTEASQWGYHPNENRRRGRGNRAASGYGRGGRKHQHRRRHRGQHHMYGLSDY